MILNLGLYGIVRLNLDLVPVSTDWSRAWWCWSSAPISALVGILYATTENDLKAMLAHSSIENIGIVTAGLGAGLIFTVDERPALAGIAFVAAFYHMVNHSVYKALLFLGAGRSTTRAGTRDLNRLGGLVRAMPWTSGAFLVGALASAALPPFNGFVSEWLTLQTMLRSAELPAIRVKIVFALCGAALALTAALAVTCFVKAFAMGFLGMSRSEEAARADRSAKSSLVPMALLAAALPAARRAADVCHSGADRDVAAMDARALSMPWCRRSSPRCGARRRLPPAFAAEFHDLGAQVGQGLCPGADWWCCIAAATTIRSSSPCPRPTCCRRVDRAAAADAM